MSKKQEELYIVCWKSRYTGATGRDTKAVNLRDAKAWVTEENRHYPYLDHWYEPVVQKTQ
jgi:hypothetical protein